MIPFIDLAAQRARLGPALEEAILKVVRSGAYIMGPEIREFEAALSAFGEAPFALTCGSGTEALILPLMAWGVGPGDAVFCPAFTFAATAEVMPLVGASPVFVDIRPDTYNLDPEKLDAAIAAVKAAGELTPRAIIAVDLFGQPADYPAIAEVARRHGLKLISDSAQGFGCTLGGKHPLHWADVTTTSFFPAKPLGCYGDGGAVLCKDERLHDLLVSLRVHGQAVKSDLEGRTFEHDPKYLNMRVGMNGRMDTIQAAVLLQKLAIFADEIAARNRVAARYAEGLGDVANVPAVIDGGVSVWAQYTIEVEDRDALARAVQQGMENGFKDCAPDLDQAVKLVHEDDAAYAHMGTWSRVDGNGEVFNSLTAAPGAGVTSFTGVKTAAGKCNTMITQMVPTEYSCPEAQKAGFKEWKAVGDLRGLPLLEDPSSPAINVLMVPTGKKTCLIIKHAIFYGR